MSVNMKLINKILAAKKENDAAWKAYQKKENEYYKKGGKYPFTAKCPPYFDTMTIIDKYKYLGSGVARSCYAIDAKYVMKIAVGNTGKHCNCEEMITWTHATPSARKVLTKCVYLSDDCSILVMERINGKFADYKTRTKKSLKVLPKSLIWDWSPSHNCLMQNGRIKIYDYATRQATWSGKFTKQKVERRIKTMWSKFRNRTRKKRKK